MAVRRRALGPDQVIYTQAYGEIAVVSDAAFLEMDLAFGQMQLIGGGVVTQIVERHPTDLPQEMVVTRAIFEWKDRTDAKPQPEAVTGTALGGAVAVPADPSPEELEGALEAQEAAQAPDAEPDGLDPSTLEEEDESAIPAEMR